jgi:two-component system cell cycle sensor histidine kinase/response regulator CckA
MEETRQKGRRTTVLVVVDDPTVLVTIRGILEAGDYRVLVADNHQDAVQLARLEHMRVDLALLNTGMTAAAAIELAEALVSARPGIRLLYLSGFVDNEFVRIKLLDQDTGFAPKPFGPDGLPGAVQEALQEPATQVQVGAKARVKTMSGSALL